MSLAQQPKFYHTIYNGFDSTPKSIEHRSLNVTLISPTARAVAQIKRKGE